MNAMTASDGNFSTALNCMDGRTQEPVARWSKQVFGVQNVDMITTAGMDGAILGDETERNRAFKLAKVSHEKHGSSQVVVVGHSECAGHPVSNEQHEKDVVAAVDRVNQWDLFSTIIGLFVNVADGSVKEVCRIEPEQMRKTA
jgi:hypothetical protein